MFLMSTAFNEHERIFTNINMQGIVGAIANLNNVSDVSTLNASQY